MNKEIKNSVKAAYMEFEKEPMDDYYNNPIFGIFSRQRVKKVIKELGYIKNKNILDVGCEAGYVSIEITKNGASTISFDVCKPAIRKFKEKIKSIEKKKIKLIIARAHNIPLKQNSIDSAIVSEVIEHLPNLESVYKELNYILKKGGRIIITFPCENVRKKFYPIIKGFGIDTSVEKNVTLFSYSLDEIKKLCEKFFKVKKMYKIPSYLFPITNIIVCEKI
jgi:ubiquinone/menaquinone biosynthesis C-methylase UbiE